MRGQRFFPIGLIIGLSVVVYGQSLSNAFVRWDDSMLIYENPIIREISWKSLKAAFTTYDPELYIPLTFMSYQVDEAIWGMNPFGFHLTNLVLHTLNAVLVWWLMMLLMRSFQLSAFGFQENHKNKERGTGNRQRANAITALFVALLWAVHPLNTEAVAWASARKDVLSTFFFLASIGTYLSWREGRGRRWYWGSILLHLCGLLSKVMTLTLPIILLLLDCWQGRKIDRKALWEKTPYFLLSAILGVVGLFGKQSALGASTFWEKFLMAPKSAVFYIQKIFWPSGFSVLYPYHGSVTIRSADFAVPLVIFVLLIAGAAWLWFRWRRASIGLWFFLVTVTPTFLNFAKGGDMDRYFASDRYAYIPSIGIFLFLGVVVLDIGKHMRWTLASRWIARAAAPLCIFLLGYRASAQARLWGNTELLLQNVLRLYGDSSHVAHNNMGNVYRLRGDIPRAIEEYEKALAIRPHSKTLANLGATYRRLRRYPEAVAAYRMAMELNPKNPEVSVGLGLVSMELGKLSDARDAFEEALANDPRSEEAHVNLGAVAMREGDTEEAIEHYRKALEANPYFTQAHYNLAVALSADLQVEEAMEEYEAALRGDPSFLAARINLGILYDNAGRRSEAQAQFRAILRYDPQNATARKALEQLGVVE